MSNSKHIFGILLVVAIFGFSLGAGFRLFPSSAIGDASFTDIVSLITGLSWPTLILISLLMFRNDIRQLFSRSAERLRKISLGNASFELIEEKREEVLDKEDITDEQKAKELYHLQLAKRAAEHYIVRRREIHSPILREDVFMRRWLSNNENAEIVREYEVYEKMVSLLREMGFENTFLLTKDDFEKRLALRLAEKYSLNKPITAPPLPPSSVEHIKTPPLPQSIDSKTPPLR